MGSSDLVSHPGTSSYYQSRNGTEDFRPVQDLWAVNSATVTLHPIVPNPYMLLGLIPAEVKLFTFLNLKDAFFCICLAPQRQPIFPFQWENPNTWEKGQLTWTWLPQVEKICPLFWNFPGIQPKSLLS
jgi:hypothetical protein